MIGWIIIEVWVYYFCVVCCYDVGFVDLMVWLWGVWINGIDWCGKYLWLIFNMVGVYRLMDIVFVVYLGMSG